MDTKIGTRIRTLRKSRGFSQEEMADRLHISQSTYSRIEKNESNNWVHLIEKICMELQIKPEELFTTEGLVQNNNDNASGTQNHTQITINQLSDKVIELYEDKIKMLEAEVARLKAEN